jgi:hypothetical protein
VVAARVLLGCALMLPLASDMSPVLAQQSDSEINRKAVSLLAGESQWFGEALRVSRALAHEQGLKILPMQGSGCIESAADLMQISQVDIALLTTDCVQYAETQGLLPDASRKLTYISRVASLPVFIITRRENETITSLAGKRIATGAAHSANFAAGELLLGGLGLPFSRVPKNGAEAIALLKANSADAVLHVGTQGLDGALDPARFHILGLSAPSEFTNTFPPALVAATSIKGLANGDVETVATSLVLATFNWPKTSTKAEKIKLFTSAYFATQGQTSNATELSAGVEGWQRNTAATQALETLKLEQDNTVQKGDGT